MINRKAGEPFRIPGVIFLLRQFARIQGGLPSAWINKFRAFLLNYRIGLPRELLVGPGDKVIQVGMWRPINAVRLSKAIGHKGKALLIEATQSAADDITKALKDNNCENVLVINNAAWHKETLMSFDEAETPAGSQLNGTDLVKPEQGNKGTIKILARRVDDIANEHGFLDADYVEVTINGAEIPALQGMPIILESVNRLFVAGMMRDAEGIPANKKVSKYLSEAGFKTRITKNGSVIDKEWGQIDGHVFGWKSK